MPDALGFGVIALAAWRLTIMLTKEAGPWDLVSKLRQAVGIEHGPEGEPVGWPETMPGSLLACPWCVSLWAAALVYPMWRWVPVMAVIIAASAVAIMFDSAVWRLKNGQG